MKKGLSLFEIEKSQEFKSLMFGRWRYRGSSKNFKDVYNGYGDYTADVPRYLFFGENDCGTDLEQKFTWNADQIEFDYCQQYVDEQKQLIYEKYKDVFDENDFNSYFLDFDDELELDEKTAERRRKAFEEIRKVKKPKGSSYWYFIINYDSFLVLYEKLDDEGTDDEVVFHIYSRWDRNIYSEDDILTLMSRAKPQPEIYNQKPADKLLGCWKAYDEVYESQIEGYEGNVLTEAPSYPLSLLYNFLEIGENGDCFIMKEGDEFNIIFTDKREKVLTRESSKNIIYSSCQDEDSFVLDDRQRRSLHFGQYKKIGNDEFLFVNIENEPDLDEKYYVYQKVDKIE